MKKQCLTIVAIIFTSALSVAQDYRIAKNSGRLELNVGKATVEGHDGNEIIFSSKQTDNGKDDRAAGLRAINSLGLEDNTGLGLHVEDKGNVVQVHQLKKTHSPDVKILVPRGVIVSFRHESQYGGKVSFRNLPNEIEVSALYNSVELENVTGPLAIETTYGHVKADLSRNIKDPVSIVSVYGYIDLTLPEATQADLKMSTSYGDIFVAPEFDLKMASTEGMVVYGDKVSGKLNGGGVSIDLNCNYGKIYVRRK